MAKTPEYSLKMVAATHNRLDRFTSRSCEHGACIGDVSLRVIKFMHALGVPGLRDLPQSQIDRLDANSLLIYSSWSPKEGIWLECWETLLDELGMKHRIDKNLTTNNLGQLHKINAKRGVATVIQLIDDRDYSPIEHEYLPHRIVTDIWEEYWTPAFKGDMSKLPSGGKDPYEHYMLVESVIKTRHGTEFLLYDPGFNAHVVMNENELTQRWFCRADESKPMNLDTGENILRGWAMSIAPPTNLQSDVLNPNITPYPLPKARLQNQQHGFPDGVAAYVSQLLLTESYLDKIDHRN